MQSFSFAEGKYQSRVGVSCSGLDTQMIDLSLQATGKQ